MHILTLTVGHLEENCYVVWDHAPGPAVVIDPGGRPEIILAALRERQLDLSHILLTHAHFDHLLAAPDLQTATGAPELIHRLDREGVIKLRGPESLPHYKPPRDLRVAEDGDAVEAGGLTVAFRHTPGHTPGACCLVCEPTEKFAMSSHSKYAIFSGDTLFLGTVGRVDLPGGSPDDMRTTLAAIAGWSGDYDVYPGHGSATTLSREQAQNPYLRPPFRL